MTSTISQDHQNFCCLKISKKFDCFLINKCKRVSSAQKNSFLYTQKNHLWETKTWQWQNYLTVMYTPSLAWTINIELKIKRKKWTETSRKKYWTFTYVKQPRKDWILFFKINYRLLQVKSIAVCSKGSILQYFWTSLSYQLSLRPLFCLFLSGRLHRFYYPQINR